MRTLTFLWLGLLAAPAAAQGIGAAGNGDATLPPGVAEAQLLPGWQTGDGRRVAALKLVLEPGWKTYWRSPGDAGVPPLFDWSGSENLAGVTFHWPRPDVFESAGMRTLGYHDVMVLPFEARPVRADQPISLSATVDLGVCEDICVPVHLEIASPASDAQPPSFAFADQKALTDATGLTLPLTGPAIAMANPNELWAELQTQQAPAGLAMAGAAAGAVLRTMPVTGTGANSEIAAALAQVPDSANSQPECSVEAIEDGLRLTARLDHAMMGRDEAVAIEVGAGADPSGAIWVSEPQLSRDGGLLTATADLVAPSGAPFDLNADHVRLTLIAGERAVEFRGCAG